MSLLNNFILNSDSYKFSHFLQMPPGAEYVNSYIEARTGGKWKNQLFFGLQAFVIEYLTKLRITEEMVNEADKFCNLHGVPFNTDGWMYIATEHKGILPLDIRAVKEGTVIEEGNVLVQVRNTNPKCFWLTSFVETALLRAVWYPMTVATQSWQIKQVILKYLEETGDPSLIGFKLHDFGARGVSSLESAGLGGMAHLINFMGTDTITGALYANKYYNAELPVGFSVPAAEHSTITSWGEDQEEAAYRNMVKQFAKPGTLVAVVSDSYDLFNAAENLWGDKLKEEVIASGATIVIRPDSGDARVVVPNLIAILMKKYGFTKNAKGYDVLPNCIRVIQGDGVNQDSIIEILESMKLQGQSADNIAFGMGGALLQGVNRDTLRFAMKASAIYIDGKWQDVYKKPATDPTKNSKRGILSLVKRSGKFETIRSTELKYGEHDFLEPVYINGRTFGVQEFADIRKRSMEWNY